MTNRLSLAAVRFTPASDRDRESGLLGWARLTIAGLLLIDGLAIRRTRKGRLTMSYPCRRDRSGVDHPIIRPVNDGARRQLEAAIFEALGITAEGGCDGC